MSVSDGDSSHGGWKNFRQTTRDRELPILSFPPDLPQSY